MIKFALVVRFKQNAITEVMCKEYCLENSSMTFTGQDYLSSNNRWADLSRLDSDTSPLIFVTLEDAQKYVTLFHSGDARVNSYLHDSTYTHKAIMVEDVDTIVDKILLDSNS